jgi:hypothetical protein
MSRDVVRHALADPRAVSDLFESVAPSVIWQKLWIRDTQVADPISKSLSGLSVSRFLYVQRITDIIFLRTSVEHWACPKLSYELEEALLDKMFMDGNDAAPVVLHRPGLRRDP